MRCWPTVVSCQTCRRWQTTASGAGETTYGEIEEEKEESWLEKAKKRSWLWRWLNDIHEIEARVSIRFLRELVHTSYIIWWPSDEIVTSVNQVFRQLINVILMLQLPNSFTLISTSQTTCCSLFDIIWLMLRFQFYLKCNQPPHHPPPPPQFFFSWNEIFL